MLRGYRFVVIAFAGLILSGAQPPKKDRAAPTQRASDKIQPALDDIAAPQRKANEPSSLDRPCDKGEDQRSSDLCAQWKAADAGKSAADATWLFGTLGSLIGGLTLAAAWSAARWAKKAADETKRGADIAEKSILLSKEAHQRELRAYIHVVTTTASKVSAGSRQKFFVEYRNAGATPAMSVQVISDRFYFDKNEPHKIHFVEDKDSSLVYVGPGENSHYICAEMEPMSRDLARRIGTGDTLAIFAGVIVYRDVFGKRHFTTFSARYDPEAAVGDDRLRNNRRGNVIG